MVLKHPLSQCNCPFKYDEPCVFLPNPSPFQFTSHSSNMIFLSKVPASVFLFFFFTLGFLTIATAKCHIDDEAGLLGFKSGITADPSDILGSWKPGTDCCQWFGVSCGSNNRVETLSLSGQTDKPSSFLSGTISPSLSKLISLIGLYLQDLKNISASFPAVLLNLKNLTYVYIENNKLSGPIPPNIGLLTKLYAFSLSGNRISGPIPSSISKLTELSQLKLGGNLLTGTIPVGIQQLKNLTYLQLERNYLTGTIPDLSSFSELRILELSHNKFSGEIPSSLSALAPQLRFLELGHNNLNGKIPDFLGKFRALDTLDLSWNHFSGIVPTTFANLTKIFNLDLSHNLLVDPFPQLFVKGIESLDLSYNGFHLGEIPKWVTSSPIIYSLKLAKCGIKIKLDNWKPAETYFYDFIDLSENEISGSPVALLNNTNFLVEFSASGNQLKFNMEGLKFPKTLRKLDLSKNRVFGKLPKSISGLEKLNVSQNHLCGPIPATKLPASAFVGNDCLCGAPLAPCKAQ